MLGRGAARACRRTREKPELVRSMPDSWVHGCLVPTPPPQR